MGTTVLQVIDAAINDLEGEANEVLCQVSKRGALSNGIICFLVSFYFCMLNYIGCLINFSNEAMSANTVLCPCLS